MRAATKLLLELVLTVFMFSYLSCKKTDVHIETQKTNASAIEKKFFNTHRTNDPTEKALVNFLQKINAKDRFVEQTAKQIGFPRWDKAIAQTTKKVNHNSQNLLGDSVQTFYIPFVRDSQNYVNASMVIHTSQTDTSFSYRCDWEYAQYVNDNTTLNAQAKNVASFFMALDKVVFGDTQFKINDKRLFKPLSNIHANDTGDYIIKKVILTDSANSITSNNLLVYECTEFVIFYECSICHGNDPDCPLGGTWYEYYQFCDWNYYPDGGGGSTPPDCGEVPVDPLTAGRVVDPCDEGPGWEPVPIEEPPFVPYVCNYQLTQHEQDVFNQLDAEDDQADQNHQNLDCQGTKRTGNVFFKGTKEHWLIQLDYVSKNPIYGDVEFAIPNSSLAGNRGYADIVNLENKSVFEIKPNNPTGLTSGQAEVANYVQKANQYCGSTIPMGVPWSTGTSYASTIIPTGTANRYLKSQLYSPGVILYNYETISNPSPAPPFVVPTSVVHKFKHLIDRLRQNFHQADRIIAEYLQQNPDLVSYMKGAAIGAGVAIIVGTIIEDFLTVGAGIADDWACFVLAYRIVRFAVAL